MSPGPPRRFDAVQQTAFYAVQCSIFTSRAQRERLKPAIYSPKETYNIEEQEES